MTVVAKPASINAEIMGSLEIEDSVDDTFKERFLAFN